MAEAAVAGREHAGAYSAAAQLVATSAGVLRKMAAADSSRLALWAPVALGAGSVLYLTTPLEPPGYLALAAMALAAAVAALRPSFRTAALAALWIVAGFGAAQLRVWRADAPVLQKEMRYATVEGRIRSIDESQKQRRIVIDVSAISGLNAESTPKRVRLSWRGAEFRFNPGQTITINASLSPPPRPVTPGGYDFSRQLYFDRIGAVGFAFSGGAEVVGRGEGAAARLSAAVESIRVNLSRRIVGDGTSDARAIVAAVVTGKRGGISEDARDAFRDSGLAHLLSISGLHMGLATGIIFFFVRAALALIERIALYHDTKKIAAIAALLSGFAYLFVSGAGWPAQRAFIMSSIFFFAILVDRRALSLRNISIAAVIIILIAPESVLHPGFQMSFAAVTALIAFYEWASARENPDRSFSAFARFKRYMLGIVFTDTIAAGATAPYSLYHFSRAANFGLAANLISIPLMAFWVMPTAIMAIAFIPLGGDEIFWRLSAAGVDVMLAAANWTRHLPHAVTVFPSWPPASLGILTIGGLWFCLMRQNWRFAGLTAVPVGALLITMAPHPQIFVSESGDNAGVILDVEGGHRAFAVYDLRRAKFDSEIWMEEAGFDVAKARPSRLRDLAPCDSQGCLIASEDKTVAISNDDSGLADDCARADLVIALYRVSSFEARQCRAMLITQWDAAANGAAVIFVNKAGIRIVSAAERAVEKPWTRHQYLRIKPTSLP